MHASIRIGDSSVMLMDESPEWKSVAPQTLHGTPVPVIPVAGPNGPVSGAFAFVDRLGEDAIDEGTDQQQGRLQRHWARPPVSG